MTNPGEQLQELLAWLDDREMNRYARFKPEPVRDQVFANELLLSVTKAEYALLTQISLWGGVLVDCPFVSGYGQLYFRYVAPDTPRTKNSSEWDASPVYLLKELVSDRMLKADPVTAQRERPEILKMTGQAKWLVATIDKWGWGHFSRCRSGWLTRQEKAVKKQEAEAKT